VHLFGYTLHTNLKAAEEQARKDKQLADETQLIALTNAAQKAHDDEIARKEAELTRVRCMTQINYLMLVNSNMNYVILV